MDAVFVILGAMTAVAGIVGLFILKDSPKLKPDKSGKYLKEVVYGFRPSNIKQHKMIYICLVGMMFSGLAMQFWQPYMIMMLQYTLGFGTGFVIPLAVVVLLSAVMAVVGGKLMDKYGKENSFGLWRLQALWADCWCTSSSLWAETSLQLTLCLLWAEHSSNHPRCLLRDCSTPPQEITPRRKKQAVFKAYVL